MFLAKRLVPVFVLFFVFLPQLGGTQIIASSYNFDTESVESQLDEPTYNFDTQPIEIQILNPLYHHDTFPLWMRVTTPTYNRDNAVNWARNNNYNNGCGYGVGSSKTASCPTSRDIGRHCATYVARAMNAGGIPVSWSTIGNHQIFSYLTGGRHTYFMGWPNIHELARRIRSNSYVADATVNTYTSSIRKGDVIFFNVHVTGVLNPQWGATHSAIVVDVRGGVPYLAYWNIERYGVAFSTVRNSFSGDYIVVRFR